MQRYSHYFQDKPRGGESDARPRQVDPPLDAIYLTTPGVGDPFKTFIITASEESPNILTSFGAIMKMTLRNENSPAVIQS